MKALILCALPVLPFPASADDLHERRLPLDEVTLKSNKYGAEATMVLKEDGTLGLTIRMNGKPVEIPASALASIRNANLATALLMTKAAPGVTTSESRLKEGLFLAFNYGPKIEYGFGKGPVDVQAGCKIRITTDGLYDGIETAVPEEEEHANQWKLVMRSKDGIAVRMETVQSKTCPMRWIEDVGSRLPVN